MHWNNFSRSSRIATTGVEEDDEHGHDDEEAEGPQEVVQEDVDLGDPAIMMIWSLPDEGKISSDRVFNQVSPWWIMIHRDPGSAIIKFCCCFI